MRLYGLVIAIGFEPMTVCLEGRCSIQLSYATLMSGWQDSNLRPPAPKAGAMTGLRYTPNAISWRRDRDSNPGDEKRRQISNLLHYHSATSPEFNIEVSIKIANANVRLEKQSCKCFYYFARANALNFHKI